MWNDDRLRFLTGSGGWGQNPLLSSWWYKLSTPPGLQRLNVLLISKEFWVLFFNVSSWSGVLILLSQVSIMLVWRVKIYPLLLMLFEIMCVCGVHSILNNLHTWETCFWGQAFLSWWKRWRERYPKQREQHGQPGREGRPEAESEEVCVIRVSGGCISEGLGVGWPGYSGELLARP